MIMLESVLIVKKVFQKKKNFAINVLMKKVFYFYLGLCKICGVKILNVKCYR